MSQCCDDGEPVEFRRESYPRAAVDYKCMACHETIRAGARYCYIVEKWDEAVHTDRRCLRCDGIYQHLLKLWRDGKADDQPDPYLECGHEYAEVHGEEPPPEIAALAFAMPWEER